MKVGPGSAFARRARCADPVDRLAARVHHPHDWLGGMTLTQACTHNTFDLLTRQAWHVDVQQKWLRNRFADIALDELPRNVCRDVEVFKAAVEQRKGDRRNSE